MGVSEVSTVMNNGKTLIERDPWLHSYRKGMKHSAHALTINMDFRKCTKCSGHALTINIDFRKGTKHLACALTLICLWGLAFR